VTEEIQSVAIPVFLRKKLIAVRAGRGEKQCYYINDKRFKQTVRLEPWQFFILEVLPGCDTYETLASVFEDRFGHTVTLEEVEQLFSFVTEKKLFHSSSESHPLIAAFHKKKADEKKASHPENAQAFTKPGPGGSGDRKEVPVPKGVNDAFGFDEATPARGWKLFNPTWLIKLLLPLLSPLKHTIYLLPIAFAAALFIAVRHAGLLEEDAVQLHDRITFVQHVLFSMVTVNLAATMVKGLVAYTYRATVSGFCLVFFLHFIPRFMVRLSHLEQLSRRERIWLHAAPLLLRLWLFSTGILIWFNIRSQDSFMVTVWLGIAAVSAISFLLTVNPLVKSDGYHMMAAFLNEPNLRGKSYKTLINKFKGTVYQKADSTALAAYGLASLLFMLAILGVAAFVLGRFLKIHLGGAGILLLALVSLFVLMRMVRNFKKTALLYERSVQFERWRDRTVPETKSDDDQKPSSTPKSFTTYVIRTLFLLFLLLLFVPYNYEPGGKFVILPNQKQTITTEIAGIVNEVLYDGGEELKKGAVIARLSHSSTQAQVNIYTAKIQEQQAVINDLKSRPVPQEVELAERALKVEVTSAAFSKTRLNRLAELYKEGSISYEDFDEAEREYEIDLKQVEEKQASLELTKVGATPEQIAAAEAKLNALKEERAFYQQQIEQSVLYMPFDGKLVTLHLTQKTGSYLNKGQPFAEVENTNQVIAEIDLPEPDIGFIALSAKVKGRPLAYHNEEFSGIVTAIGPTLTETRSAKVVKVITLLDNRNGQLKTGMTGYAKISSERLPVWKVLSLAIVRFIKVEAWSWLP